MKKRIAFLLLLGFLKSLEAQNVSPCADLFISEYDEGSSNNKAIELYNPTASAINLSDYKLVFYFNGGTSGTGHVLSGSIGAASTFVISSSTATNATILAASNATISGASFYNGNDAVELIKISSSDTLDILGQIGTDPGATGWVVDTGSTTNHSLVRKPSINNGQLHWTAGALEWNVLALDDFSNLGTHSMNACNTSNPTVLFGGTGFQTVGEGAGNVTITVNIVNPNANATSVTVTDLGTGTATQGSDYTYPSAQTVTFPAGSSTPITLMIPIVDDALPEGTETIHLSLTNPTNSAAIGSVPNDQVSIADNDSVTLHPVVSFQTNSQSTGEGAGNCQVVVTITNPNASATSVNVQFVLAGSTATPGSDFTFTSQQVTFPAGSSANQMVSIPIIDDSQVEGNEIIHLQLSGATNGATLGIANDSVTITDNDTATGIMALHAAAPFVISPNPVHDLLTLYAGLAFTRALVLDVMGTPVLEFNSSVETARRMVRADISKLPAGIYIVQLFTTQGIVTGKMIKE